MAEGTQITAEFVRRGVATEGEPGRSRSSISRPRGIGICMVVKNSGPVFRMRVPGAGVPEMLIGSCPPTR
jgi:hypothetical protein